VTGTQTAIAPGNMIIIYATPEVPTITALTPSATLPRSDDDYTLSVSANISSSGPLSYQWRYNTSASNVGGMMVPNDWGGNTEQCTVPLNLPGVMYYYVEVINANGNPTPIVDGIATSDVIMITVNTPGDAVHPTITTQPQSETVTVNTETPSFLISFDAETSDGGTLTYQWYYNTTASNIGGTLIPGMEAPIMAVPILADGVFHYYVVVTNTSTVNGSTASVTSNLVTITVIPAP